MKNSQPREMKGENPSHVLPGQGLALRTTWEHPKRHGHRAGSTGGDRWQKEPRDVHAARDRARLLLGAAAC